MFMHLLVLDLLNFIKFVVETGTTDSFTITQLYYVIAITAVLVTALNTGVNLLVNRQRIKAETDRLNSQATSEEGSAVETFQKTLSITAKENQNLVGRNISLQKDIEKLRCEMIERDEANKKALVEMKTDLQEAIARGDKFEEWARRLVYQLQSWKIDPVPLDVELEKEKIRQNCIE
jgi:hypothetical protein